MRTLVWAFAVLAWLGSPRARAAPADPMLGFAPAATDIVLCSDIAALESSMKAQGTSPARGVIERLKQLQASLPFDALRKLHVRTLCTFHVRDTDHQLALFELDRPLPAWLTRSLDGHAVQVQKGDRTFLAFSLTPGLVAASTWTVSSRLDPMLARAANDLLSHRYWGVVEPTAAVRSRLVANTGAINTPVPELETLAQLRFSAEIAANDNITLEVAAKYATPALAASHGRKVGVWIPFSAPSQPVFDGDLVKFTVRGLTYQDLNEFLSHF